jgi:photosystem II stability/assembly factor-like uncharacterized protein
MVASTALAFAAVPAVKRASWPDPLDVATQPSDYASKGVVSGIARQGERLIAVGPRGLILVSTDAAVTWKQAASPVATDLVSVKFQDADTAWAVGHDAIALRTQDGGASWQKVLDGRSVLTLLRETYTTRAKAGDKTADALLAEVDRSMEQSATPDALPSPFLDVWFANASEGYLVGAFGLVLRTLDGGKQWEPIVDQLDNDRRFHLYAVTGNETQRFIAGEQGLLLQFDAVSKRFLKLETPYAGTFFGVDLRGQALLVYGLRGNAYVRPSPAEAWIKIDTGTEAHIVSAIHFSDEQLVLVSQSGQLLQVSSDFRSSKVLKNPVAGEVLGAVSSGPKRIALARLSGVGTVDVGGLTATPESTTLVPAKQ